MNYEKDLKKIIIGFDVDGVLTEPSILEKTIGPIIVEKLANLMYKFKLTKNIVIYFYKKQKPNQKIIDLISKLKKEDGVKIVLITGFQGDRELIIKRLEQFNIEYDELYNFADRINKEDKVKKYKVDLVQKLGLKFYIDNRKDVTDAILRGIGTHFTTNSELDIEKKIFERITKIRSLWESETTEKFNELMQEVSNNKKGEVKEGVEAKEWSQTIQKGRKETESEEYEGRELVPESRQEVQREKRREKKKGEVGREGGIGIKYEFKIR